MSKRRFYIIFIAASVSAFLGGFVCNQLYLSANAVANDTVKQQSIQPHDHKIPPGFKVVEANQFRLIDLEGNCLAKLTIEEDQRRMKISAMVEASLDPPSGVTKTSKVSKKVYRPVLEMEIGNSSMRITEDEVEFRSFSSQASLSSGNLFLKDKSFIKIYADNSLRDGTSIEIYDEEENKRAALGSVNLNVIATGEIQKRPESSLVLFGKDGKVVYSAP